MFNIDIICQQSQLVKMETWMMVLYLLFYFLKNFETIHFETRSSTVSVPTPMPVSIPIPIPIPVPVPVL